MRPVYDKQRDLGAVFGLNSGWEHPFWFADQPGASDTDGFTRQNWWGPVGEECRALRESAGIIDISNFAKYRVKGPAAEAWLNAVFANIMPREVGRTCLTPLISLRGGIVVDATVTRMDDDEFLIISSCLSERCQRRFYDMVPLPTHTAFDSMIDAMCGFNTAGPRSLETLQSFANTYLQSSRFRFMHSKWIDMAGVRCLVFGSRLPVMWVENCIAAE